MKVAKPSLSQMSCHRSTRHRVAEPLVRELVDDQERPADSGGRVGGPGLGLEGEPGTEAGHHAAGALERIRAQLVLQPRRDRRAAQEEVKARVAHDPRQLVGDRDDPRSTVGGALADGEGTGGEEGEVRRHRLGRPPVRRRQSAADPARDRQSVGDDLVLLRHRDPHVHGGLVARMVVGREPPRRHVRLVHGHDLAAVSEPVALTAVRREAGPAAVVDLDREGLARRDGLGRRDAQLVGGAAVEVRAATVDADPAHREQQVEVEPRQGLRRPDPERRPTTEDARGEVVAVADVVVQDVDAAVPVQGEVRVADPGRADAGRLRARAPTRAPRSRSARAPPTPPPA